MPVRIRVRIPLSRQQRLCIGQVLDVQCCQYIAFGLSRLAFQIGLLLCVPQLAGQLDQRVDLHEFCHLARSARVDQRVPLDLALSLLGRDKRTLQSPFVFSGAAGFLDLVHHGLREIEPGLLPRLDAQLWSETFQLAPEGGLVVLHGSNAFGQVCARLERRPERYHRCQHLANGFERQRRGLLAEPATGTGRAPDSQPSPIGKGSLLHRHFALSDLPLATRNGLAKRLRMGLAVHRHLRRGNQRFRRSKRVERHRRLTECFQQAVAKDRRIIFRIAYFALGLAEQVPDFKRLVATRHPAQQPSGRDVCCQLPTDIGRRAGDRARCGAGAAPRPRPAACGRARPRPV